MRRIIVVAAALAGALLVTSGAQAKAPPDGVQICGTGGVCSRLSWEQAETMPALWTDSNHAVPAAPSPFYLVRWHWPNQAEHTAYYIPRVAKIRHVWQTGVATWADLATDTTALRAASANLEPFAVPSVTSVTVGGRPARDPQSYLRLFGRGYEVWPAQAIKWIRVKIVGEAASPWTDTTTDVFVSRRGRYLSVDGTILRIPLQLGQLIRAGRSLR